eukprot:TRINITY_DN18866_c0_g1_i1.p1 TRINITY_DN18866_c0_g1~~TRINITY_DN18866_c0_g1_i1.p1  ORF type:complete len:125 (-),score=30.57 TRINITY_DN18866_c0_g1_i1:95-469(-)
MTLKFSVSQEVCFMKLQILTTSAYLNSTSARINSQAFEKAIMTAYRQMIGEFESCRYPIKLIHFSPLDFSGILSVSVKGAPFCRSALTLCNLIDTHPVAIHVLDQSSNLATLFGNSRQPTLSLE